MIIVLKIIVVVVVVETGPTRRPDRFIDSSSWRGVGWWGGLITCFAEEITAHTLGLFHLSTAVNFEVC